MATDALDHDCLSFGDFTIDRADERLIGPQGRIRLGNKAYRVLVTLAEQQGCLVTKDALFETVWDGTIVSESALTSVVKELRRALGDESRTPRYIESVYGRGYRLIPKVEAVASEAKPDRVGDDSPGPPGAMGTPPLLEVPDFESAGLSQEIAALVPALREDILLALSRFRDVALVLGERPEAIRSRGHRLEIKLLRRGPVIAAFARIVRIDSGTVVWADQIELTEDLSSRDADRLAQCVTAAAYPRMQDDYLLNAPAATRNAWDRYRQLRLKMRRKMTLPQARELAAEWERLIESYPDFAPAYLPLIRMYNNDFLFSGLGTSGSRERQRARELARRAAEIDPFDSTLQSLKGWCDLRAGDVALARPHLEQALELNPYDRTRLVEVACGFIFMDDLDRAEEILARCRKLLPLPSEAPHEDEGLLKLLRRDFAGALQSLTLARGNHPEERFQPSYKILMELYELIALAGLEHPDAHARAKQWRDQVAAHWCGEAPLTPERLLQWIFFHNPFSRASRQWIEGLLRPLLGIDGPAPPDSRSIPPPALAGGPRPAA